MAMYAKPILAVCRDQTETRDEFLEYMKILGVLDLRLRTDRFIDGTVEIVSMGPKPEIMMGVLSPQEVPKTFDVGEALQAACAEPILWGARLWSASGRTRQPSERAF